MARAALRGQSQLEGCVYIATSAAVCQCHGPGLAQSGAGQPPHPCPSVARGQSLAHGHDCVRALQVLLVWAGGQASLGIFSIFCMATVLIRLSFPHSEIFGNATSLLFFLSGVFPTHLDACLSLGSLLSFLEDSLYGSQL